jgi:hypothetical protein
MNRLSFASLAFATKKRRTKREIFLGEMDRVVPWWQLEAVIEPHYPKAGGTMLRGGPHGRLHAKAALQSVHGKTCKDFPA